MGSHRGLSCKRLIPQKLSSHAAESAPSPRFFHARPILVVNLRMTSETRFFSHMSEFSGIPCWWMGWSSGREGLSCLQEPRISTTSWPSAEAFSNLMRSLSVIHAADAQNSGVYPGDAKRSWVRCWTGKLHGSPVSPVSTNGMNTNYNRNRQIYYRPGSSPRRVMRPEDPVLRAKTASELGKQRSQAF